MRSFTADVGVDVISFGGTKNGMMYGEAVVYLDATLARSAPYLRKQATQLPSKMRFISAQFTASWYDDLRRAARQANAMATPPPRAGARRRRGRARCAAGRQQPLPRLPKHAIERLRA